MSLPDLAPHELEALACLAEECGEAVAIIGKALRHGLDSTHPNGGPDNREEIGREVGNIMAMAQICMKLGVLNRIEFLNGERHKWVNVGQYLHHIEISHVSRTAKVKP